MVEQVTIRGAGILGLSCAWFCAKAGAHVRVIDPLGPGGGASGGVVGALAPHTPENWNSKKAFQFESLLMARAFWPEVEEVSGLSSGYARTGRWQPIADEAALNLARQRRESAARLWQGQASWQIVAASQMDGWGPAAGSGYAIHDTLSAHIHPRLAVRALAAALRRMGVEFVSDRSPVGPVIWATGAAGLADLTAQRGRLVGQGIKGQAAVLDYPALGAPQLFVDTLHIIPHLDGTVAVGSTTEREYQSAFETDARLETVIMRARAVVPCLRDAPVLERWAGLRPRARTRAPILGPWPDRPGHFIANGGFKIGFGMAPKIGQVMADLVLSGRDAIPEGFRVSDNW